MWLAVISVTVIIGAIWLALVRYNIGTSMISAEATKNNGEGAFSELREKLREQMDEIKGVFDVPVPALTPETATTTSETATSTEQNIKNKR
ncbi:hypothetical protein KJ885_04835 [Patescibacteria group bacterium]|nr:hypothetical protein [Patescibacteria group bacterium]